MDPVSQGLVGAVLPQSVSNKKEIRLAALVGFLSGVLADIDVLIRSSEDPLLVLEYHRHFTHSLIFIPVGGLVAAGLLWPFMKKRMSFGKVYLYATLGYATAGLLDACTNYGTQLLWPFSDWRIGWNVISIIDPVFTLMLACFVVIAVFKNSRYIARAGLAFAVLYLLFGLFQRERAEDFMRTIADGRGHEVERITVHPSIGNLVLWRSIYESEGEYYVDAVRAGLLSGPGIYEGGSLEAVELTNNFHDIDKNSVLYKDILRFQHFSDGYLVIHPDYPNVLGDLRYSLLPNSVKPLWGIEINMDREDQHVSMSDYDRNVTGDNWRAFLKMLRGEELDERH
ncbi:MAG: metal-dependent hydrolase [Deltaproteobacteria bacterium]